MPPRNMSDLFTILMTPLNTCLTAISRSGHMAEGLILPLNDRIIEHPMLILVTVLSISLATVIISYMVYRRRIRRRLLNNVLRRIQRNRYLKYRYAKFRRLLQDL